MKKWMAKTAVTLGAAGLIVGSGLALWNPQSTKAERAQIKEGTGIEIRSGVNVYGNGNSMILVDSTQEGETSTYFSVYWDKNANGVIDEGEEAVEYKGSDRILMNGRNSIYGAYNQVVDHPIRITILSGTYNQVCGAYNCEVTGEEDTPAVTMDVRDAVIKGTLYGQQSCDLKGDLSVTLTDTNTKNSTWIASYGGTVDGNVYSTQKKCGMNAMTDVDGGQVTGDVFVHQTGGSVNGNRIGLSDNAGVDGMLNITIEGQQIPEIETGELTRQPVSVNGSLQAVYGSSRIAGGAKIRISDVSLGSGTQYLVRGATIDKKTEILVKDSRFAGTVHGINGGSTEDVSVTFENCTGTYLHMAYNNASTGSMDLQGTDLDFSGTIIGASGLAVSKDNHVSMSAVTGATIYGASGSMNEENLDVRFSDVVITENGGMVEGTSGTTVAGDLSVSMERIHASGKDLCGIYESRVGGDASFTLSEIYDAVNVDGVKNTNIGENLDVEIGRVCGASRSANIYGFQGTGEIGGDTQFRLHDLSNVSKVGASYGKQQYGGIVDVRMSDVSKTDAVSSTDCYTLRDGATVEENVTVNVAGIRMDRIVGLGGFNGGQVDVGGKTVITMKDCEAAADMYGACRLSTDRGVQLEISGFETPAWYGLYGVSAVDGAVLHVKDGTVTQSVYGCLNNSQSYKIPKVDITMEGCTLGTSDTTLNWTDMTYTEAEIRTHVSDYTARYTALNVKQNDYSKQGNNILRMDSDTTKYYVYGDYTFEKMPAYVSETLPDIELRGDYIYRVAKGVTLSTSTLCFDRTSTTEFVIEDGAAVETEKVDMNYQTNLVLEGTLKLAGMTKSGYNNIFMRGGAVEYTCSPANVVDLMSTVNSIAYYPVSYRQNFPEKPETTAFFGNSAMCKSYPEENYQLVSSGSSRRYCSISDVTGYRGVREYRIVGEDGQEITATKSTGSSTTLNYLMPAQPVCIEFELDPKQIGLEQKFEMPVAELGATYTKDSPVYDLNSIYRKNDAVYGEPVYILGTEDGQNNVLPEGLTLEDGKIIGTPTEKVTDMEVTFCVQGKNTSKAYITMKMTVADTGTDSAVIRPDIDIITSSKRIVLHGHSVWIQETDDGQIAITDVETGDELARGDYSKYAIYGYYQEPVTSDISIYMESGTVAEVCGAYGVTGEYRTGGSNLINVRLRETASVTNLRGAQSCALYNTYVLVDIEGGSVTGTMYGTDGGSVDGAVQVTVSGGTVYRLQSAYGTTVTQGEELDYAIATYVDGGTVSYLQDTYNAKTTGVALLRVDENAVVTSRMTSVSGCHTKFERISGKTTMYGNYEYKDDSALSFMDTEEVLTLGSGATLTVPAGMVFDRDITYSVGSIMDVSGTWNCKSLTSAVNSGSLWIRSGAKVHADSMVLEYLTVYNEGTLKADEYTGSTIAARLFMNKGANADLGKQETPTGIYYEIDWESDLAGTTISSDTNVPSYTVDGQTKYYQRAGANCVLLASRVSGAQAEVTINDEEPFELSSGSTNTWNISFTGKYEPMHVSVHYEPVKAITLTTSESEVTGAYGQVYSEGLPMFDAADLEIRGDYRPAYGSDVTIEVDEDTLPQGMAYQNGKLTGTLDNYRGENKDVVFTVTGRNGTQTQYVLHVTVLAHEHRWSEPESNVDEKGDTWSIRHCEICNDEDRKLTATATPVPTQTPSETPEITPSAEPSETPEVTPSAEPCETPEVTPSAVPGQTPGAQPSTAPSPDPQQQGGSNPAPQPGDTTPGKTDAEQNVITVGGVIYTVSAEDAVTVTGVDGKKAKAKSLKIVDKVTINGNTYKVTAIGKNAFAKAKKLKKLTVKATGLTSVHKTAFKKCPKKLVIRVPKKQKKAYIKLFRKAKRKVK